jgi:glycosyltransferase involved in cell wall biosynthesis
MMRVLIIAYTTYIHDGRVKRHAEALTDRGDSVDVICLATAPPGPRTRVNVIGIEIPRYRGASRINYVASYVRFFTRAAILATRLSMEQRYDVVMVCTMPDAAVLCALIPKWLGSAIVLDVHDTMPELYQDKFPGRRGSVGARLLMVEERASAWMADRVLAVHEPHKLRLERAGVAPHKIRTVMNVPDPRLFHFRPGSPLASHREGQPFTVVCHGTLTQRLGLDVGFRAMALVKAQLPLLHLRVIGTGDYLAEANEMVVAMGLSDRVSFHDPVPIERLPALLQGAALGLVPNHPNSATHLMLPVKLLEYAMLGIPVVSARLHTIEYYFDQSAICYFAPDDPVSLGAALTQLYHAPQQREALVRNAYRIVHELGRTQRERYYQAIDSLLPAQEALTSGAG